MKYKTVIEVITESYAEEQYILSKFPNASWIPYIEKIIFYIPYSQYSEVVRALYEWKEQNEE